MKNRTILRKGDPDDKRKMLASFILGLSPEKDWQITVEPYRKKRSLNQNAYLHMILGVIANETGNSIEDVKEFYKYQYLGTKPILVGEIDCFVSRSTTELSTKEMADFTEKIIAHAQTELGIILPAQEGVEAA